jgi:hypothetical protein
MVFVILGAYATMGKMVPVFVFAISTGVATIHALPVVPPLPVISATLVNGVGLEITVTPATLGTVGPTATYVRRGGSLRRMFLVFYAVGVNSVILAGFVRHVAIVQRMIFLQCVETTSGTKRIFITRILV